MDLAQKTVGEIALEIPGTVRLFEELKIDYCCGGKIQLEDACETAKVSLSEVEEKISNLSETVEGSEIDIAQQLSPSRLIDSIIEKHHVFTRNETERLAALMKKVSAKHSERHPELIEIEETYFALCDDLMPHMNKEEMILFPFIKSLEVSRITKESFSTPPFGTVRNPVRMMENEHEKAGDLLKKLRTLTSDFSIPDDACPSFEALYSGLEELEKDLHRHIHLENNLLFPMAIELEAELSEVAG